jgi:hypothetical protein
MQPCYSRVGTAFEHSFVGDGRTDGPDTAYQPAVEHPERCSYPLGRLAATFGGGYARDMRRILSSALTRALIKLLPPGNRPGHADTPVYRGNLHGPGSGSRRGREDGGRDS